MGKPSRGPTLAALAAIAFGALYTIPAPKLIGPTDLTEAALPWYTLSDIWTDQQMDSLMDFVKKHAVYRTFQSETTSLVEDAGERTARNPDGSCPSHYLIPSALDPTTCVLPSRFDSARHHFSSGGYGGFRESYDRSVSRLLAFQHIFHAAKADLNVEGELAALFDSDKYKEKARAVCGADRTLFDHIQLGVIIQVPGQEVAAHLDVPWFKGATRFNIPQWLLVVMESSKLFADRRVPQIQGVAYLHKWQAKDIDGGGFYFYPDPEISGESKDYVIPAVHPPISNSAIVVDGAQVVHGTVPYRDNQFSAGLIAKYKKAHGINSTASFFPDPPQIRKGEDFQLHYRPETDDWAFFDPKKTGPQRIYKTEDLRVSLVWRSRCFKDEQDRLEYTISANVSTAGVDPSKIRSTPLSPNALTVDGVLDSLEADLRSKGILKGPRPSPMDFALLLVDSYVKYPLPVPVSEGAIDAFLDPVGTKAKLDQLASEAVPFSDESAWGFLPGSLRSFMRRTLGKANFCLAYMPLEGTALNGLMDPLKAALDKLCG